MYVWRGSMNFIRLTCFVFTLDMSWLFLPCPQVSTLSFCLLTECSVGKKMNISATQWAICRSISHSYGAKKQHAQFCPQCHLLSAPHDSFSVTVKQSFFVHIQSKKIIYTYTSFFSYSLVCWFISESVKSINSFCVFLPLSSSLVFFNPLGVYLSLLTTGMQLRWNKDYREQSIP